MAARKRSQQIKSLVKFGEKEPFSVHQLCNRLQVHGILDIYESKSCFSKLFWSLTVATFVAILGYSIYSTYDEYNTNPITTTLSLRPSRSLRFPQITICPANYINFTNPRALRLYERMYRYYLPPLVHAKNISSLLDTVTSSWAKIAGSSEHKHTPVIPPSIPLSAFKPRLLYMSFKSNAVLRECQFQGQLMSCANISEPFIENQYGVCYHVNVNSDQHTAGLGLRLLIDLHPEAYPAIDKSTVLFQGAVVKVQHEVNPASFRGVFVSPGQHSKIDVSASYMNLVNIAYSKTPQQCTHVDQFKGFKIFGKILYSRDVCIADCVQQFAITEARCLVMTDRDFIREEYLQHEDANVCTRKRAKEMIIERNMTDDPISRCTEKCHNPCEHWSYSTSLSSMQFPSSAMKELYGTIATSNDLPDETDVNTWGSRFALVDIAYDTMEYWITTQSEAMSFTALISSVGGLTGLWLGASLLTLVQLAFAGVFFLIESLRGKRDTRNGKDPDAKRSMNPESIQLADSA